MASSFEDLLRAFLSPDNGVRKQAEATLANLRTHRDELPLELLKVLESSSVGELRMTASVLLRKVLLNGDDGVAAAESSEAHYYTMTEAARGRVEEGLLSAMARETVTTVRRRLCDTLAEVALLKLAVEDAGAEWPALWMAIQAGATGNSPDAQDSSMLLLEMLGDHVARRMKEHLPALRTLLMARMGDGGALVRVRTGAARAATAILTSLTTPSEAEAWGGGELVPSILHLLRALVASQAAGTLPPSEEEAPQSTVGTLIDIADAWPTQYRACAGEAVAALAAMAANRALEPPDLRRMCLEALLTLAESSPTLVRKLPHDAFLRSVLPVCLGMLLEHGEGEGEDEEEGGEQGGPGSDWEAADPTAGDGPEGGAGAGEGYLESGESGLDRLGTAVGAKRVLPVLLPLIARFMDPAAVAAAAAAPGGVREPWKYRLAAMTALAQTSEMVPETDATTMASVARAAAEAAGDAVPRVRHAAQELLCAFCYSRGPEFQEANHGLVAVTVLRGLGDASRRVRASAAGCVGAYCEKLDGEADGHLLEPYLRGWLEALFSLVEGGIAGDSSGRGGYVREYALSAVSSLVAAAGGDLVTPLYAAIMPGVLRTLNAPPEEPEAGGSAGGAAASPSPAELAAQRRRLHGRRMKGKALEALSILAAAVGPEVFRPDAAATMAGMLALLGALVPGGSGGAGAEGELAISGDDPVAMYLWDALGRVCAAMGPEQFSPFLHAVLPPLLRSSTAGVVTSVLTLQTDSATGEMVQTAPDGSPVAEDGAEEFTTVESRGHVSVRVKTAAVEEKLSVVTCLVTIVEVMRCSGGLAPFAPALVGALTSLVATAGTCYDDVRICAAAGLGDALATLAGGVREGAVRECYRGLAAALPAPAAAPSATDEEGAGGAPPPDLQFIASQAAGAMAAPTVDAARSAAVCYLYSVASAAEALRLAISDAELDEGVARQLLVSLRGLLEEVTHGALMQGEPGPSVPATPPAARLLEEQTQRFLTASAPPAGVPALLPLALRRLTSTLLGIRSAALQRRAVRAAEARVNAADMDETALETAAEADREDEGLLLHVAETLGCVLKSHGEAFLPVFAEAVAPWVVEASPNGPHAALLTPIDTRLSLFLMDDALEARGCAESRMWQQAVSQPQQQQIQPPPTLLELFLPVLLHCCPAGTDATLRQASLFGLGAAAASASPAAFAPFLPAALSALMRALHEAPGSRGTPEDNAATSLGRLLRFHFSAETGGPLAPPAGALPPRAALMDAFLACLPLEHDEDEEAVSVGLLAGWLNEGDPHLLPPGAPEAQVQARLQRVLGVLAEYLRKPSRRRPGTVRRDALAAALQRLQSRLPAPLLMAVWGGLSAKHREALASLSAQ